MAGKSVLVEDFSLNRRDFVYAVGWVALVLSSLQTGCNVRTGEHKSKETMEEKTGMIQTASIIKTPLPAIDVSAPARTGVATFALG